MKIPIAIMVNDKELSKINNGIVPIVDDSFIINQTEYKVYWVKYCNNGGFIIYLK